ncbi:MAG: hypothetical protein M3O36_01000 [Myxococcota bacterium]|nr:hypothetical protein [Myxococcota bacterium]
MTSGLDARIEDLRGFAGHLLDLYDSARMDFKNPRSLTKLRILKKVGRLTGARTLVETGNVPRRHHPSRGTTLRARRHD